MNLQDYFTKGYSYQDYLRKVEDQLLDLEKFDKESSFINYYSMNLKRIDRLDKSFELNETQKNIVSSLDTNFSLLVISEGWCGDAAQTMPIINKIIAEMGVEQRIVLRDVNLDLMNHYLTDGAKSIPIYIGIDKNGQELFRFGPRPKEGMQFLKRHKENPEIYSADQFHKDLQIWYNQDKGDSTFKEFVELIPRK